MPKLSELIPFMARTLGVAESSVSVFARHARAEGLLSSKGRGPGGAEMTATDCTNLLLAIMAGHAGIQAKDAPGAVIEYRALVDRNEEDGPGWAILDVLSSLSALPEHHTFGSAIDALIHGAETGELVTVWWHHLRWIRIAVARGRLLAPPTASIEIRVDKNGIPKRYDPGLNNNSDDAWMVYPPRKEQAGDLESQASISQSTIFKLGMFLSGQPAFMETDT